MRRCMPADGGCLHQGCLAETGRLGPGAGVWDGGLPQHGQRGDGYGLTGAQDSGEAVCGCGQFGALDGGQGLALGEVGKDGFVAALDHGLRLLKPLVPLQGSVKVGVGAGGCRGAGVEGVDGVSVVTVDALFDLLEEFGVGHGGAPGVMGAVQRVGPVAGGEDGPGGTGEEFERRRCAATSECGPGSGGEGSSPSRHRVSHSCASARVSTAPSWTV